MNAIEIEVEDKNSTKCPYRHRLSMGRAFIATAVGSLLSIKPDRKHAKVMYEVGLGKLNEVITEMDLIEKLNGNVKPEYQPDSYGSTIDPEFPIDNKLVIEWTEYFQKETANRDIFSGIESTPVSPRMKAIVVGSLWHEFSSFMPWFLCQAAAMVSTNEKRHYVIQTAFEELGMRNSKEIHPDMFFSAAKLAGLTDQESIRVKALLEDPKPLDQLRKTLLSYTSDAEVLGILLGLEIPAIENIETVFESLGHSKYISNILEDHIFFKLHRQVEIEHVRLTVSNFLRFCTEDKDKNLFLKGFSDGLNFWKHFWKSTEEVCALYQEEIK